MVEKRCFELATLRDVGAERVFSAVVTATPQCD